MSENLSVLIVCTGNICRSPTGEAVLNEPEAQKAIGGDRYVASMRDAIDATLAALSDPPAAGSAA